MTNENYKIDSINRHQHQRRLLDKTIKLKGTALENRLGNLDELEDSKIYHHPSFYDKQIQKKKIEPYEKALEYRGKKILDIIHDPTIIGLPKYAKPLMTSFLKDISNQNKIHLFMEADNTYYPINLKIKDTKTGRKNVRKRLIGIKNTLLFNYRFEKVEPLYISGENLKADALENNKFTPFNYTQ